MCFVDQGFFSRVERSNRAVDLVEHVQHADSIRSTRLIKHSRVMADWTILPVVCGQRIIEDWISLLDIVNFDHACRSHQSRSIYLQWCRGVVLPKLDIGTDVHMHGSSMNTLLQWLLQRGISLRQLTVEPDEHFKFAVVRDYLHSCGSAVTDVRIEFDTDLNRPEDFSMVDVNLFLAELNELCPNVRALTIRSCFSDGDLTALGSALPHLETLNILRCEGVTAVGLAMIGKFCGRLQKLTIEGVTGSDNGDALRQIGQGCTSLTELSLFDYDYSPVEDIEWTDIGITQMLKDLPSLTYLKLGRVDRTITASIAEHLHQLKHLTLLDSLRIGDPQLQALFTHCTALQRLELGPCHDATDVGMGYLRHLTHFSMCNSNLVTAGEVLGRNNPHLESVKMESIGLLTGAFVLHLVHHCSRLTELEVWKGYRRPFEVNSMSDLVGNLLREQYPQLQRVVVHL